MGESCRAGEGEGRVYCRLCSSSVNYLCLNSKYLKFLLRVHAWLQSHVSIFLLLRCLSSLKIRRGIAQKFRESCVEKSLVFAMEITLVCEMLHWALTEDMVVFHKWITCVMYLLISCSR